MMKEKSVSQVRVLPRNENLFDPLQAAAYLRISLNTLRGMVARREIMVTLVGTRKFYLKKALDDYLENQTAFAGDHIA